MRNSKKIKVAGLILLLLPVVFLGVFFGGRALVGVIRERIAIHRFDNMPRDAMIEDFEYLMTALEENWPFFNLSVSAKGVDVHQLADNVRRMLNDPSVDIGGPIGFLDMLHEHFLAPINQLGHLRATRSYERFFDTQESFRDELERGAVNRATAAYYELYTRPEVVMFYTRLKNIGEPETNEPTPPGPVLETDIIEDGKTAYLRVNRMINVWDDTASLTHPGMWHYEAVIYDFVEEIETFEHLIIDLRGNRGGITLHLHGYVLPPFLREHIRFPAYVFYMGGEHSTKTREIYDVRHWYPPHVQSMIEDIDWLMWEEVHINEPFPIDTGIDFAHVYESVFNIVPGHFYYGQFPSAREDTLFNGKIWLLIDERTASSAEATAAILKYNNIATVVGEATFGAMGTIYEPLTANLSLPNTGILIRFDVAYYTDREGRPLQGYGVQPHYFKRPGMDALETVLAMIGDGDEAR